MANTIDIKANLNVIKNNIQNVVEEAISRARSAVSGGGVAGGGNRQHREIKGLLSNILTNVVPIGLILKAMRKLDILELIVGLVTFAILFLLKPFIEEAKAFWKDVLQPLLQQGVLLWQQISTNFPVWIQQMWQNINQKIEEKWNQVLEFWATNIQPKLDAIEQFWKTEISPRLEGLKTLLDTKLALLVPVAQFLLGLVTIARELGKLLGNIVNFVVGNLWGLFRELKVIAINTWISIKEWFKRTVEKVIELKDRAVEWLKNVWDKIKELPGDIWDFLKGLPGLIADALGSIIRKILPFGGGGKGTSVEDAIIRPDGSIIRTDPQDTLIAVKNLGLGSGGGGNTFIFNGVTQEEFLDTVKRELGIDQFRAGRF